MSEAGPLARHLIQHSFIWGQPATSHLRVAIGRDQKGKTSAVLYAMALGLAFVRVWIAIRIYVLVAMIWLSPDRRLEETRLDYYSVDMAW